MVARRLAIEICTTGLSSQLRFLFSGRVMYYGIEFPTSTPLFSEARVENTVYDGVLE